MKTAQQIADTQAMFEILAGEKYSWTPELTEVADGYFTFQICAQGEENPVRVHEAIAMSVALICYANTVGWIAEAPTRTLIRKANQVRGEILARYRGKVVAVRMSTGAATPATSH